jgi:replication initiator protein RepSA
VHVVRFGEQLDIKGVQAGTPQADKLIGYLTKYLTKAVDACHTATTDRQRAHLERMWAELRYTPCSSRCANWLRYGIQPKHAHKKQKPGHCKARVHQMPTLGLGGRRVLVSRQWSGKTLTDHRHNTRTWVRALLGLPAIDEDRAKATHEPGTPAPIVWELARPDDRDVPPWEHRLLRHVSERIQLRTELDKQRPRGPGDVSASDRAAGRTQ